MDNEKKKIEKLEHPWADNNSGCGGASYDDIIDKINEIVDMLNGKEEPELAESEDELIRMWLIDCVKAEHDCYFETVTREQVLSYLEKQKEPKATEMITPIFKVGDKIKKKGEGYCWWIINNINYTFQCYEGNYDEEAYPTELPFEEQGDYELLEEQKPLSPEEKMNHPLYLEGFDVGRKVGNVEAEQKPVEWSETDEEWYMLAKESVLERWKKTDNPTLIELRDGTVKWLRELAGRIYQEQEWSEEDEEALLEVKLNFEINHEDMTPSLVACYERFFKKVKSLRPSWKPSVWQMTMLRAVINDPNNAGAESCQLALTDLYEQLKQL